MCELAGPGSGGVQLIDCDKIDQLPEVVFHIAGKEFKLTGKDYVLQVQLSVTSAATGIALFQLLLQPRALSLFYPLFVPFCLLLFVRSSSVGTCPSCCRRRPFLLH
jgi:hypothetical protein